MVVRHKSRGWLWHLILDGTRFCFCLRSQYLKNARRGAGGAW